MTISGGLQESLAGPLCPMAHNDSQRKNLLAIALGFPLDLPFSQGYILFYH